MSLKRVQQLYPYCIFRAKIIFKNVAPPDNEWAKGVLCRDFAGSFFIINKTSDNSYSMCPVDIGTLGLASGFKDGIRSDIFEGDILRISRFSADDESKLFGSDEDGQRRIYADIPFDCEKLSAVDGVVFMNGGVFYIQFFDEEANYLNAMPLHMFFGFDLFPQDGVAAKVIGNIYDDEELYAKTLHLGEQAGCSSGQQEMYR